MSFHQTKLKALDYIRDHTLAKGEPPTMREIAYGINHASPGSAHRIVAILEAEGKVRRVPGKHRGIEIVPTTGTLMIEFPAGFYDRVRATADANGTTMQSVVIGAVEVMFEWQELLKQCGLARTWTPLEKHMAASRKAWRSRKRASRETGGSDGSAEPGAQAEHDQHRRREHRAHPPTA